MLAFKKLEMLIPALCPFPIKDRVSKALKSIHLLRCLGVLTKVNRQFATNLVGKFFNINNYRALALRFSISSPGWKSRSMINDET